MLEFLTMTQPKARKQHKCYLCNYPIVYGERYVRFSGKYDGEFFDNCYHAECDELIDSYCDDVMDSEWDHDAIIDWLSDRYCRECQHGTNQDDDCTVATLLCGRIRAKFREGRRRKKEDGDAEIR